MMQPNVPKKNAVSHPRKIPPPHFTNRELADQNLRYPANISTRILEESGEINAVRARCERVGEGYEEIVVSSAESEPLLSSASTTAMRVEYIPSPIVKLEAPKSSSTPVDWQIDTPVSIEDLPDVIQKAAKKDAERSLTVIYF